MLSRQGLIIYIADFFQEQIDRLHSIYHDEITRKNEEISRLTSANEEQRKEFEVEIEPIHQFN